MIYHMVYVATDGPSNKRSTRVLTGEETVEAETEGKARFLVSRELRDKGFTKVRITRTNIIVKGTN